ncbi:unnamed protein product [Boreogadus saida]
MADTTVTHQPATESTNRTPINGMGDTWLDSQGKTLKEPPRGLRLCGRWRIHRMKDGLAEVQQQRYRSLM